MLFVFSEVALLGGVLLQDGEKQGLKDIPVLLYYVFVNLM